SSLRDERLPTARDSQANRKTLILPGRLAKKRLADSIIQSVMRNCYASILFLVLAVTACISQTEASASACNAPPHDAVGYVSLPGRPFGIAVTKDGCDVFVAVMGQGRRSSSGIALLRRAEGKTRMEKFFSLEGKATDIVLTHDQKMLIVAGGQDVAFMDAERMLAHKGDPVLGYMTDADAAGSINVNVTRDDRFLFVSDEGSASIRVIDLEKARNEKFSSKAVIGRIPVGIAPIALVFSPDGKVLYTTSEASQASLGWGNKCKVEGEAGGGQALLPEGAVIVVDVETAKTDPEHSVLKWLEAGCSPVRAAISPAGDFLYVTARASDAVLVYATARMVSDPAHALVATVPTGKAPVGITIADGGKKLMVANSNRFGGSGNQTVTVIDATKVSSGQAAVLGTIPAQSFPREFASSPDGKTIFLSNFSSNSLEVIDLARVELK
ncbi:MAG TPA: YncE family protein, partial [Candidatus Angelobacter sp.]